jgi:hypothetical protein
MAIRVHDKGQKNKKKKHMEELDVAIAYKCTSCISLKVILTAGTLYKQLRHLAPIYIYIYVCVCVCVCVCV